VRRLLFVLVLLGALPAWAGAATIIGKARGETVQGTRRSDLIDVAGGGRDTVRCQGGLDTVVADSTDRVAADCETVARRIARDTTRREGQHETIVEPAVATAGSTVVTVFQSGRRTQGAADAIGFATSTDAGATWRSGLLPSLTESSLPAGPWQVASDPVVAYDALHGRWIATALVLDATSEAISASTSTDGLTWSPPVAVASASRTSEADVPLDKEWVTCDNWTASPHRGRCYVAATASPDTAAATLVVWLSDDGGATWTQTTSIPRGYFAQIVARPSGQVVLFYLVEPTHQLVAAQSGDGGVSFAPGTPVAASTQVGVEGLRAPSLPSLASGPSGEVVAVWSDCIPPSCGSLQVETSRSTDGTHWSPPAPVPLGAGSHVLPSVAIDPEAGTVAIADYVLAGRSCCALVAQIARSADGGATWLTRRASVRPMPESWLARADRSGFLGDYVGIVFGPRHGGIAILPLAEPPTRAGLRQALFAVRF
jgi:hypothetical protein